MKFTFPILTLCLGGAQRMLAEITNGLVEKGHDVTILMPQNGVISYDIKAKIKRTRNATYITEEDYPVSDIIVSNYYTLVPSAQAASEAGKGLHVRFALCYEPTFTPENHLTFPSYNVTKNVIVISKWQQQIMKLNHGINAHIVPVGINPIFRNFHLRNPRGPLKIGAVVRRAEDNDCWHRNQAYLLNQLRIIKQSIPSVQIYLTCPSDELASAPTLNDIVRENKFSICSALNDEEMCHYYNQIDIFVSSSIYDAVSLPAMEAGKCGCALVSIYAGGNVDFCKNNHNCLLSYAYEQKLSDNVFRLIGDYVLREKLAKNAEKDANVWMWHRSVEEFEKAIYYFINNR